MTQHVRFIHAADLHLDAPFKGVDATDPRVRDELVSATYGALDAVVEACIANAVDFLVLAGDVYNHAERSLRAEFAFRDACVRLAEAGIHVYVARGNHDPASGWSAGLTLPPEVHVFSADEVERITHERDGEVVCALYGRSFKTAAETANLAREYHRGADDTLAIGVLHANVGGLTDHAPYAPCSLDDLRAAGMDYWALGHIHKPEVLSETPSVVYPGCTQGLNPNESGPRGCRLVTLGPDGVTTGFVPTARVAWAREQVRVEDAATLEEVRDALAEAAERCAADAGDVPVVVRYELTGRTPVHAQLARPGIARDLLADVRADGLDRPVWIWADRITDATRPAVDLDGLRAGEDLSGDLVRLADRSLSDDAETLRLIDEVARPVLGLLEQRDVPALDAADLLERARDLALDHLLAGDER